MKKERKPPKIVKSVSPKKHVERGRPETWSHIVLLSLQREVLAMSKSRGKGNMDACRQVLKKKPWCNIKSRTEYQTKAISLKTFYNRFLEGRDLSEFLQDDTNLKKLKGSLSSKIEIVLDTTDTSSESANAETAERIFDLCLEEIETMARVARKEKVARK